MKIIERKRVDLDEHFWDKRKRKTIERKRVDLDELGVCILCMYPYVCKTERD
jgi:hypothetical protein